MKKLFIVICALFVGFAYGANENVPTSKKFVDAALAQKQPKFEALGNDKLMLYSNTTDGVVASRDIVTTLGNSTSANTVPTVGAINTGLNTKQDTLNGDAGWVVENTGIAGAVAQKPIYSATNNYSNALVEAETLNNAVINAVNSELTVVPGVGWTINTAANLNLLPVPRKYIGSVPDGYTQLEYLESTGTQWIDTGIAPSNNTGLIIDFQYTNSDSSEEIIIGALNPNFLIDRYSGYFAYAYRPASGIDEKWSVSTAALTARYTSELNWLNSGLFKLGNIVSTLPSVSFSNQKTLYIFTCGGLLTRAASGRVYYLKISNNLNIVRNFIPARRNSDNALGMYDTVSGTFFTNAGTGTFTAGPVAN